MYFLFPYWSANQNLHSTTGNKMSEAWLLSCKLFVRVAKSISFLEGKFPDFFNLLQDYYAAEMTVSTTRLWVRDFCHSNLRWELPRLWVKLFLFETLLTNPSSVKSHIILTGNSVKNIHVSRGRHWDLLAPACLLFLTHYIWPVNLERI